MSYILPSYSLYSRRHKFHILNRGPAHDVGWWGIVDGLYVCVGWVATLKFAWNCQATTNNATRPNGYGTDCAHSALSLDLPILLDGRELHCVNHFRKRECICVFCGRTHLGKGIELEIGFIGKNNCNWLRVWFVRSSGLRLWLQRGRM